MSRWHHTHCHRRRGSPSTAELLPGSDPTAAADEIRAALDGTGSGCQIRVRPGVAMLPAYLPPERRGILTALDAAIRTHHGEPKYTIYGGTFNAGGPYFRGIPP